MKIGMRKPSIKKSIKARTTGRAKRAVKSAVNPLYGKKGMGWVNDPKKAAYNKVYNKTTVGVNDVIRATSGSSKINSENINTNNPNASGCGCLVLIVMMLFVFGFIIGMIF